MKIRLKEFWNYNEAGDVIDVDVPVADLLIARAIAEPVDGAPKRRLADDLRLVLPKPSEIKAKLKGSGQ